MARAPFQVLVLPYRLSTTGLEVAVFRRSDYKIWQFVSGGGEGCESPHEAACREGFEEAEIATDRPYMALSAMTMIPACWFSTWETWPPDCLLIPEYAFAVEVADDPRISREHTAFSWCAYDEAMSHLRFDSNRNALWELHERLFPGPHTKRPAYS